MQVKVHLSFPSKFAGPLIGKKASNLAHIKKFSGARNIHVFPKDRDAPERYIEIIGTPLQQYFVSMFHCFCLRLILSSLSQESVTGVTNSTSYWYYDGLATFQHTNPLWCIYDL